LFGGSDQIKKPGGDYNTAIGYYAGRQLVSGSYNIIIGAGAQAPIQDGDSQIAIGTEYETMYIRGGHNWRFYDQSAYPNGITVDTTLTFPFAQVYPIFTPSTTTDITITLPTPTQNMTGAHFVFKKVGSSSNMTVTFNVSGGTIGIIPFNATTQPLSVTMQPGQFQSEFICNGFIYYQMFTM